MTQFIHNLNDAKNLFLATTRSLMQVYPQISEQLVEKDYWIMHALWGLQQNGFEFQLKGGTSLSKAYRIIDRFSEDIDIYIKPSNDELKYFNKNHDKPKHIECRTYYFNHLAKKITIPGMNSVRDHAFDDSKMRKSGIRLEYESFFDPDQILKEGILLEIGFDQTQPNQTIDISCWAMEHCQKSNIIVDNNLAFGIPCYNPEYTFVEKLHTVSKKVRQQQDNDVFSTNFLRHYYDIYKLLHHNSVLSFIGTEDYFAHKDKRFGQEEPDLTKNLAFNLDADKAIFAKYSQQYAKISGLFIKDMPSFEEIFEIIQLFKAKL